MNIDDITDDQLTLYFYDDGLSAEERAAITAALDSNRGLACRYAELATLLSSWQDDRRPAPTHLLHRLHDSIDRAAVAPRSPRGFSLPSFAWGAAITAALALGVGIGYFTGQGSVAVAPVAMTQHAGTDAFTRGLRVHLRDTERGIAALHHAEDRTLLVLEIIHQNRIFERAAEHNDSAELARVLRAFEPILLRLAADDLAPADADALREQLAFELKIMLTKLERRPSKRTQST